MVNVIKVKEVIKKGAPIIIPNADELTPEQLKRAKHAEKVRRLRERKIHGVALEKVNRSEVRKMNTNEMVELAKDTRNKAVELLNKRLLLMENNDEELGKIRLTELATVFGILFDKAQLASGLATENIAIHSKIDINVTSDQALEELNRMREKFNQENTK